MPAQSDLIRGQLAQPRAIALELPCTALKTGYGVNREWTGRSAENGVNDLLPETNRTIQRVV
jgi:hypothetical protein